MCRLLCIIFIYCYSLSCVKRAQSSVDGDDMLLGIKHLANVHAQQSCQRGLEFVPFALRGERSNQSAFYYHHRLFARDDTTHLSTSREKIQFTYLQRLSTCKLITLD